GGGAPHGVPALAGSLLYLLGLKGETGRVALAGELQAELTVTGCEDPLRRASDDLAAALGEQLHPGAARHRAGHHQLQAVQLRMYAPQQRRQPVDVALALFFFRRFHRWRREEL